MKPDGSGIVTDVNYKLNPFDEIAVEEALRLKEKRGGEVVVASIGPDKSVTELRAALADLAKPTGGKLDVTLLGS